MCVRAGAMKKRNKFGEWFRRRRNRKLLSVHFFDNDIMLDEKVRINNIDIVPNVFESGDEVSFWMNTG